MEIQRQIQELNISMKNYPNSSKGSFLKYNIKILFETLSKKEEKELMPDDKLRKKTLVISANYGNLAGKIGNVTRNMNAIYKAMENLDNEILENLDGIYKLYVIQWGLSVKALWYFINNEFDKAIKLTQECIEIIDELITKGMYCLIFRNVEQNKNLAFVLKRIGQVKSSNIINGDILKYYFSGRTKFLTGSSFQDSELWIEMPYLRESFGYIHFREQVEIYYDLQK